MSAPEPPEPAAQLQMTWPGLASPPVPELPEDYELRQYSPEDEANYLSLMASAGFDSWDSSRLSKVIQRVLPDGFFLVAHRPTGVLAATALATHNPNAYHPFGGELSWVAGDPRHAGRRLGRAVCAAATSRMLSAGYRAIYLLTDDFRLPAIKTYLRLGYQPLLKAPGTVERWQAVCSELGWPIPG